MPKLWLRYSIVVMGLAFAWHVIARVEPAHEASLKTKVIRGTRLVGDKVLLLNGTGIHRRLIFQVYALSLYLVRPSADEKEILATRDTKYVEMKFLRNVSAVDIRDGFRVSYEQNCGADCERLKSDFEALIKAMPDAKVGTVFEFRLFSDKTVIHVEGQPDLSFDDLEFGRLLLKTWIGDKPPSERFKNEVLGRDS